MLSNLAKDMNKKTSVPIDLFLNIIRNIEKDEFTSHDFIKQLLRTEAGEDLYRNLFANLSIQAVNAKIARILAEHHVELRIEKTERVESETFHGTRDYVQGWKKVHNPKNNHQL